MTILYFGPARDCAGRQSEQLEHDGPLALDDLWGLLIERHPRLAECRGISRVAVDMEYLDDDGVVPDGAEVAIIPPVAGG
jgi:molybdopterin converting factor small subunit